MGLYVLGNQEIFFYMFAFFITLVPEPLCFISIFCEFQPGLVILLLLNVLNWWYDLHIFALRVFLKWWFVVPSLLHLGFPLQHNVSVINSHCFKCLTYFADVLNKDIPICCIDYAQC